MSKELYRNSFIERLNAIREEQKLAIEAAHKRQIEAARNNSSPVRSLIKKLLSKFVSNPSESTNATYRNYSEVFSGQPNPDPETLAKQIEDIEFHASSIAAVLHNRINSDKYTNKPELIKPTGRSRNPLHYRDKGYMVKSEHLENSNNELGIFIGTVLMQNGELRNTNQIAVSKDDLVQGIGNNSVIPESYIDLRIAKANNRLHPITLENGDLSYQAHIENLAKFVINYDLDNFNK